MSAENPFKNSPKTKEEVEKYIVTEGQDAGRMKADTPEALAFATEAAHRQQAMYEDAAAEYARAGTRMTVEDVENEINGYIKQTIAEKATSEVMEEGKQLLAEMRAHPEYRKGKDPRSGFSKEFLSRLENIRRHMRETYQTSKDEVGKALGETRESA